MALSNKSLTKTFYISNLLGIALSILCVGTFWLYSGYQQLSSETEILKTQAVQKQMEKQMERVHFASSMIKNKQQTLHETMEAEIRQRTLEAHAIMESIYERTQSDHTTEQIAELIKAALRDVRFNKGRGYYFINRPDGIVELYPPDPPLEGTSFYDIHDQDGRPVVQEMIRLIQEQGEGALRYTWSKPGDPAGQHEKIAYIKHFEPLNWIVSTGEYVADIEADLQNHIVDHIEKIRFDDNGYIFIGNFSGTSLTYPAKGRNMYDVQDANGLKIVQEMIQLAKNGEGYLRYVMPPLKGERTEPKISYVVGVPEWNWYIGTGDFEADLDYEMATMLAERKSAINHKIAVIITILAVFILVGWYFSHFLGKQVSISFEGFQNFFDRAAQNAIPMDLEKQKFSEFKTLALSANHMIDARQKAETIIKSEEKKFRTLFEHVSDYAIILQNRNNQMTIVDLSASACESHGYLRDELIGQPITILDPEETEVTQNDPRMKKLLNGETIHLESVHRRKGGSTFPVEALIRMIEVEGQQYLFSIESDLTEKKKTEKLQIELEEQLRQKYKMEAVGLMAGGVAHNFNNALAIVLGNLEMAQRKISETGKVKKYIETAQTAVLRSRDLISQILIYSRKGSLNKMPIQLSSVYNETLKLINSTNPATIKLTDTISPKGESVSIYADSGQIQEALINLYTNATHALDEKGEITFSLVTVELTQGDMPAQYDRSPGVYARVRVQDNGCGIPPDTLTRIFDPFFTTKEINVGTGMGLSTVQGIVDQHEGFIKVRSDLGKWTIFDLYFPATEPQQLAEQVKSLELSHGSEKILLVDDDEMLIDINEQMLAELGYSVTSALSGKQALGLIKKNPQLFDLVITDQTMPEMTGKELSVEIMKINAQLPIILCSGYSSKISATNIDQYGIKAYCAKPVRLAALAQVVRKVLDQKV
ncbi:MAG: cache domain-containing protein [Desulfuromusa sp.]|nr:cache domain-containing protein [Desulfuromusa sp.]